TIADNMEFLLGTKPGGIQTQAAQSRVLHPLSTLGWLGKAIQSVPGLNMGADAVGRYVLHEYYKMMTTLLAKPSNVAWLSGKVLGDETDKIQAREVVQGLLKRAAGSDTAGQAGAGVGAVTSQSINRVYDEEGGPEARPRQR